MNLFTSGSDVHLKIASASSTVTVLSISLSVSIVRFILVGNEKLDTKIEIRPKLDTIIRNLTDE